MLEKIVYINFADYIDPIKANRFISFVASTIAEQQPTELYFLFSSNGGDIESGFVLYNFLKSLQTKVAITMHNIGSVDSVANIIFLAGQKRYAAQNAAFLFHGVSYGMTGNYTVPALRETLSRMEAMEIRMAKTICINTKLTSEEVTKFYLQGEGKDVQFAVDKGIISEVKEPIVPFGAIHFVMNFV